MDTLSLSTAQWLCCDDGLHAVETAVAALDAGDGELTVAARLRAPSTGAAGGASGRGAAGKGAAPEGDHLPGLDPERATAVMAAATARRRARGWWPHADQLLLTPVGLEQASAPEVAAWRARRLADRAVWDLGAGVGGDALALAVSGARVTAVDLDAARLRLLAHNAAVLDLEITTRVADVLRVRPATGAWLHADPGRRRDGRRVRRLAEHLPPVDELVAAHTHAQAMAVVLSPAVDLDDPALPAGAELEFIEDGGGLRESVVWLGAASVPGVVSSATLLPAGLHRRRHAAPVALPVGDVGSHLVEVVPAAVRARLHGEIGAEVGARRLGHRRALLTSDGAPPTSPWYRARRVVEVLPARDRLVRRWLADHDVEVELATHGLQVDPQRWWRSVGRPARGPNGLRVELVRTDDGALAIISDPAA